MASAAHRSMGSALLSLNLIMYVVVAVIAGWAINYSIDESRNSLKGATPPVRLFPIYFPIGNLATGFFVIFALVTGVVGISTSLAGLHEVSQGYPASMMSAAASALVTWTHVLQRTLEAFTIILTATQLLCAVSLHAGAHAVILETPIGGRV
ncbi:Plasma membrane associated protein [Zea mays]|uniref:Plasma membrane associated protein n=1 Tax=Zea mays TaxID=4577 RepID=A0A1D6FN63_MAIZE|nr:Plasma membrane associated protein [Zea mays]